MLSALSPEELQALLTQVPKKSLQRRRLHRAVATRPYSLQTSLTLTPRQRAMMRQWAEQAMHALRYALISTLRLSIEVRLQSDGLVALSEMVKAWQGNAFVASFATLGDLGSDHCLALTQNLAMVALDRMLGGPGLPPSVQRPLSRLEINLLMKFAELLGRAFVSVLNPETTEPSPARVGNLTTTPEQLSLLTDQQSVYAFCYELRLGAETGQVWFCLRPDALKGLEQPTKHKPLPSPERLYQHPVAALPLTLRVRLGRGRMTLNELRRLQVGDVIVLDAFKGTPAQLCFGDRTLCLVRPGVKDGQCAVQILSTQRGGTE
jgi:flagellar motor switch protein FliM